MNRRQRAILAGAGTVGIFLLVQVGALALARPFARAGVRPVEDPSDPTNSLLYLVGILVASGGMLLAFRYGVESLVHGFVLLTSGLMSWIVLSVVLPPIVVAGFNAPATVAGVGIPLALYLYPEWYVIDSAGVLMGAGAAGLLGITFDALPALVLLVALAVYDAISVYRTRHMLSLAEGAMDLRIPVLFVVPTRWPYSFLDAGEREEFEEGDRPVESTDGGGQGDSAPPAESAGEEGERDALFVGLGDAVMPTILVASAATFADVPAVVSGLANLPAVGAAGGTLVGLVGLLTLVFRGRAHAGLPLLNGGAIAGYLVGALAAGIPLAEAVGVAPYL